MKIHVFKKIGSESKGLFKKEKVYEIYAWYELNDEEMGILEKEPSLKKQLLFHYHPDGNTESDFLSPTVLSMTTRPKPNEKGIRFFSKYLDGLDQLENNIIESGKKLKSQLDYIAKIEPEDDYTIEL